MRGGLAGLLGIARAARLPVLALGSAVRALREGGRHQPAPSDPLREEPSAPGAAGGSVPPAASRPELPRPLRIRPSPTPDPLAVRFSLDLEARPEGCRYFASPREARGHPVASRVFGVPGVRSVLVFAGTVTVRIEQGLSWRELEGPVSRAIAEGME